MAVAEPEPGDREEHSSGNMGQPLGDRQTVRDRSSGGAAGSGANVGQLSEDVIRPLVLVPVRIPLEAGGEKTIRQAIDLASELGGAHLFFLHVNLQYSNGDVTRRQLQQQIEESVGDLSNASYHARDTFFLEEAILNEATLQGVEYVVIGHSRRKGWRRWLARRLGTSIDLETVLEQQLSANLVVV